MGARTPPPPSNPVYSYMYPAEYTYSPGTYPGSPVSMPPMPPMEQLSGAYFPQCHPHYLSHHGHAPPSPVIGHSHLPPSPVMHGSSNHCHQTPPTTPDRSSSSSSASTERGELKILRQLSSAITKMQTTIKDIAERQGQILDRMSLLEQRAGRMDDAIEKLLESTEAVLEDTKSIRARVEDSESHDGFEAQVTELLNDVVKKMVGGFGDDIKEIKKSVQDTQKCIKLDPFSWTNRMAMAQQMADAAVLGEEPQKEVSDV